MNSRTNRRTGQNDPHDAIQLALEISAETNRNLLIAFYLFLIPATTLCLQVSDEQIFLWSEATIKLALFDTHVPVNFFAFGTPLLILAFYLDLIYNVHKHSQKLREWYMAQRNINTTNPLHNISPTLLFPFIFDFLWLSRRTNKNIIGFFSGFFCIIIYAIIPIVSLSVYIVHFSKFQSLAFTVFHLSLSLSAIMIAKYIFLPAFSETGELPFYKKNTYFFLTVIPVITCTLPLLYLKVALNKDPVSLFKNLPDCPGEDSVKYLPFIDISHKITYPEKFFSQLNLLRKDEANEKPTNNGENTEEFKSRDEPNKYNDNLLYKPFSFDNRSFILANFSNSVIPNARFKNSFFSCAKFNNASFQKTDMSESIFYKTEMKHLVLHDAKLTGAYFIDVHMEDAELIDTKKLKTNRLADKDNFKDTKFFGSNLTSVNLQGTWLDRTTFKGSDLAGIKLTNATLHNVSFLGTKLSSAQLDQGLTYRDIVLDGSILLGTTVEIGQLSPFNLEFDQKDRKLKQEKDSQSSLPFYGAPNISNRGEGLEYNVEDCNAAFIQAWCTTYNEGKAFKERMSKFVPVCVGEDKNAALACKEISPKQN